MAVLQKFCCCCHLRTGTTIFGWLQMIFNILLIAVASVMYMKRDEITDEGYIQYTLAIFITIYVMLLIADILLIMGASFGNRLLLLPWLVLMIMYIVASFVTFLVGGIVLCFLKVEAVGIIILCIGIPYVSFIFYIWLCVLTCFQLMHLEVTPVSDLNEEDTGHSNHVNRELQAIQTIHNAPVNVPGIMI